MPGDTVGSKWTLLNFHFEQTKAEKKRAWALEARCFPFIDLIGGGHAVMMITFRAIVMIKVVRKGRK